MTGETSGDFIDFVIRAFQAERYELGEDQTAALAVQIAKADKDKLRAYKAMSAALM